jgi:hypothetical protein
VLTSNLIASTLELSVRLLVCRVAFQALALAIEVRFGTTRMNSLTSSIGRQ